MGKLLILKEIDYMDKIETVEFLEKALRTTVEYRNETNSDSAALAYLRAKVRTLISLLEGSF